MKEKSLAVIGAGRVGIGLARALRGVGYRLTGIVSRRPASARRASRHAGKGTGTTSLARAVAPARTVLICVPDRNVLAVARQLASLLPEERIVLHTSGSVDTSPLSCLRPLGAKVGCFHPLTSFGPPQRRVPSFGGVAFALEGDAEALVMGRTMARDLGGEALSVPSGERAAYHLAATLLATDLVALLDTGFGLAARRLGTTEEKALKAFMPLVRAVLENVEAHGTGKALTGPVPRGDLETVRSHLQVLTEESPEILDSYRLLSRLAARIAYAEGRIDRSTWKGLLEALDEPHGND